MDKTREDILISRIAVGEADDREWDELAAFAETDPGAWRRLAEAHRDHTDLGVVMHLAADIADGVGAPTTTHAHHVPHVEVLSLRRTAYAGWLVAALILLSWVVGPWWLSPSGEGGGHRASLVPTPALSAQEAFDQYLVQGRAEGMVLSEAPRRVLLQTRPVPSGDGYELIYIQQIMERTVVPNLYQVSGEDEQGRPSLTRLEQPVRGRM